MHISNDQVNIMVQNLMALCSGYNRTPKLKEKKKDVKKRLTFFCYGYTSVISILIKMYPLRRKQVKISEFLDTG